jgi:mannan endo-1,4-beta-mannosidase
MRFISKLAVFVIMLALSSCPSDPEKPGKTPPVNPYVPGLSPNAERLWSYINDQYGKYIISGQMDTAWTTNATMDMTARVFNDTGKYPALKGFDLLDLPHSWSGYGKNQIDEAVEWWNGENKMNGAEPATKLLPDKPDIHGIVAFCWHWRVTGNQFYTNQTDFRIPWKDGKLDTESSAFRTIKNDLDKVAALFQTLKDLDIPVLWRPLHEARGNWTENNPVEGWFWWGASGPEPCIALWEYMYEYLTVEKRLNNLIWVWNGQHKAWYPDPDTVHIVGYDAYTTRLNYSSQYEVFRNTLEMVPAQDRIVALTENGEIPDPDNCLRDNAMWSFFMTWNDRSGSTQGEYHRDNYWTGEYHNTQAHKTHVFNHELVITLDELPDLTKYGD